ncbi:hypothetical protein FSP39_018865 [Pinctada imbricata]|uniref:Transposase domain-containing protein n=1 Tax=Pinctada imbricata TaxID=66713 RepID=A0AA88YSK8_PINIB|nr:hypothetical protein FSP39_018865 [Pinctada imbricata]
MINVDWFQPFKRRPDYSVGVVYMVILNLPRTARFKMENVILVGIIPNLSKEPSDLNSFLEPLVQELMLLQNGLTLTIKGRPEKIGVTLLCASSDIPAARKLSGFMGHAAIQGCSLCDIKFLDKDGSRYCGPVDSKWKSRSREDHLKYANRAIKANTLTKQKEIQKESGFKYTKLLDLEYFHPSRFSVVEPMHNLFLGTAKKMFVTWIDRDIICKEDLVLISEKIKKLQTSSDIGRIPTNIASNYGTFTAEEWKNWVLIYSLFCLSGILQSDHLKAWQRFVLACRHLCQPTIPKTRLRIAHRLFLQFTKDVEELYGPEFLTPNIHLHGHLVECIENYGSIYGFWAFSFERYNGFLADFPTNNRSVEVQLMRKFQQIGFAADIKFKDLGEDFNIAFKTVSELNNTEEVNFMSVEMYSALNMPVCEVPCQIWSDLSLLSPLKSYQVSLLQGGDRSKLVEVYSLMYGRTIDSRNVARLAKVYHTIEWNNEMFGSSSSTRGMNYKVVLAKWASNDGSVNPGHADLRPGCVKHYILHTLELDGKYLDHLFAVVDWYKSTDDNLGYLPPVAVFSAKQINEGAASFLPVHKLQGKCAWTVEKRGHQSFIIVSANCPRLYI